VIDNVDNIVGIFYFEQTVALWMSFTLGHCWSISINFD